MERESKKLLFCHFREAFQSNKENWRLVLFTRRTKRHHSSYNSPSFLALCGAVRGGLRGDGSELPRYWPGSGLGARVSWLAPSSRAKDKWGTWFLQVATESGGKDSEPGTQDYRLKGKIESQTDTWQWGRNKTEQSIQEVEPISLPWEESQREMAFCGRTIPDLPRALKSPVWRITLLLSGKGYKGFSWKVETHLKRR